MMHRTVAALALGCALVASTGLTGCCGKSKKTGGTSSPGTTGELVTIPDAGVKLNAPGGWLRYPAGRWVRFKPADNTARLAFATFDKPGESTTLIGQMAGQLDIGAVDWRGNQAPGRIGPNSLPAMIGKGDCKVGGTNEPCYIEYATVNPGGSNQILIVYVVNLAKGAHHKANAAAAVQSLSKLLPAHCVCFLPPLLRRVGPGPQRARLRLRAERARLRLGPCKRRRHSNAPPGEDGIPPDTKRIGREIRL